MTHALQDQHFNLEKALEFKKNTSDSRAALHSLAEGDALLTMVKAAYEENDAEFYLESLQPLKALYSSIPQTQQQSKIPPLLMLAALAPYRDGLRFVEDLFKRGGIPALNAAWLAPPTTKPKRAPCKFLHASPPPIIPKFMMMPLANKDCASLQRFGPQLKKQNRLQVAGMVIALHFIKTLRKKRNERTLQLLFT